MPAQQLGQILGEGGTWQHHVTTDFVRLLLQVSLHVGKKANNRSPLLELGFQLGNQAQGLHAAAVEIENNKRRILFPVLLHAVSEVLFAFDEFDFNVQFARRFLNLGLKKEIIDEAEDA